MHVIVLWVVSVPSVENTVRKVFVQLQKTESCVTDEIVLFIRMVLDRVIVVQLSHKVRSSLVMHVRSMQQRSVVLPIPSLLGILNARVTERVCAQEETVRVHVCVMQHTTQQTSVRPRDVSQVVSLVHVLPMVLSHRVAVSSHTHSTQLDRVL